MGRTYTDPNGVVYDKLDKMCAAWNITVTQFYNRKNSHKDWSVEQILTAQVSNNRKHKDHTGEEGVNNEGKRMIITACPNSHNMTVLFPDSGLERTGVYYTDFKKGMVKELLSLNKRCAARIGERIKQNNGSVCEVIEAYSNRVVVRFDNGHVVRTQYSRFRNGEVGDGTNYHIRDLTGNKYVNDNGEEYTVLEDDGNKLRVLFTNGIERTVPKKRGRCCTYSGMARKSKLLTSKYKIGEIIVSKSGHEYKVTKLYPRPDRTKPQYVDVTGPDGEEAHVSITALRIRKRLKSEMKQLQSDIVNERNRRNGIAFINSVMGKNAVATCGTPITITGGTGKGDITIQTDDGRVYRHKKYYLFIKNQVSLDAIDTIHAKKKNKYIGMRVRQLVGYMAELVDYTDHDNILVKFDDGAVVNTTTFFFTHGQVPHPNVTAVSRASLNEYTLLYSFRDAGFSKKAIYDKSLPDLYGKELDIYNPELKVAIEYDGFPHIRTVRRDKDKDRACKACGIDIYRIREPKVPLLNDDISREYPLEDGHYFSPSLRSTMQRIATDINEKYHADIQLPDLTDDNVKKEIIRGFSEKESFTRHIGDTNVNNDGYLMEIIGYRGYQRVDVRFENGYVTTDRSLSDFQSGKIKCIVSHVGEVHKTKMGHEVAIISQTSMGRVDVRFEDGTIVKNKYYSLVKRGEIAHPDHRELSLNKYIGMRLPCKNGEICTVIKARRSRQPSGRTQVRVDVRFDDGTIVKDTALGHAKNGYVKKPGNIRTALQNSEKYRSYMERRISDTKERYMSKQYVSMDGYPFTVIRYHDNTHLRIRFEDGFELNVSGYMINKNHVLRYTRINSPRNTIDFDEWVAKAN